MNKLFERNIAVGHKIVRRDGGIVENSQPQVDGALNVVDEVFVPYWVASLRFC
jgi:hypothetical protein